MKSVLCLACLALITLWGSVAAGDESCTGCIPDPSLCEVTDFFAAPRCPTCDPNPTVVRVISQAGPVANAYVSVEFSEGADDLMAWCSGQSHPVLTGYTDLAGEVSFEIDAGGCIPRDFYAPDDFVIEVRANDLLIAQVGVNSPDTKDDSGHLTTDPWTVGSTTSVALTDGIYHGQYITTGEYNFCTDFNHSGTVDLEDAIIFDDYITNGATCHVQ